MVLCIVCGKGINRDGASKCSECRKFERKGKRLESDDFFQTGEMQNV